jgi:hypothetical protein
MILLESKFFFKKFFLSVGEISREFERKCTLNLNSLSYSNFSNYAMWMVQKINCLQEMSNKIVNDTNKYVSIESKEKVPVKLII